MDVVGHEGVEVAVAFSMIKKAAVVGGAVLRQPVQVFAEAAVKTFDHAVIGQDDFGNTLKSELVAPSIFYTREQTAEATTLTGSTQSRSPFCP